MIRIAVCGSHSTGKTTLLDGLAAELSKQGIRNRIAPEPIRALEGRLAGASLTDRYLLLVGEHLRRLDTETCDALLLDRTLMDLRVYLGFEQQPPPALTEMVDELLRWYVGRIDLWFYLPIEIPLVPDGRRPPGEAHRRDVDASLCRLAKTLGLPLVEIRGGPAQRVAMVLKHLEGRLGTEKR